MISSAKAYSNRAKVRKEIFYAIKNNTKDFESEVYDMNKPQTITAFSTND